MKTLNILITLVCIVYLSSCQTDPRQQYLEEQLTKTVAAEKVDVSALKTVNLLPYLSSQSSSAVVVVNSDCSYCVVNFIEFAKAVKDIDIPLKVVIASGDDDFMLFFVEREDKELLDRIELIDQERVFVGDMMTASGDVYIFDRDNKAINYFNYETKH